MAFALAFNSSKTKETYEIVSTRLKKGRQIDSEVSDFLRERASIEERYAQDLLKLSKKTLQIDKDQLGAFYEIWDVLLTGTADAAEAHKALSVELSEKLERPLRSRADVDPGWARQKQHETDLTKLNREYEDELRKTKKSGDSEGKISFFKKAKKEISANSDTASAIQKLRESHANKVGPILDRIQAMDESRIAFFRDTLEKLVITLSVHAKKLLDIPDRCLASVLSLDVQTQIEAFCAKKGNNDGTTVFSDSASNSIAGSRHTSVVAGADFTIPAPAIDSEGFSIPLPAPTRWPEPTKDSDDEEEAEAPEGIAPTKLKIAIKTKAIEDNPDAALKTMKSLAATLQKMPTIVRKSGPQAPTVAVPEATQLDFSLPAVSTSPFALSATNSQEAETTPVTAPVPAPVILQPLPAAIPVVEAAPEPIALVKLHTVVTETINAIISDNSIEKLMITGEIAVSLEEPREAIMDVNLAISNYSALEKVVLNPNFVAVPDSNRPSDILLNMASLMATPDASATVLKYKVEVEPSELDIFTPLMVTAIWKSDGNFATVIIGYQYNDDIRERVSLKDASFLVTLENSSEVTSVQNKPATGVWNAEKKALLWKVGDIEPPKLGSSSGDMSPALSTALEPQRLIARFEIPGGSDSVTGLVTVRFTAQSLLSGIDIETAFGEPATIASASKSLVTGKYLVHP